MLDFYHRFIVLFFSCLKFLYDKNTEKQYLVIISSYRARAYEPQVDSRYQATVGGEVGL